MNLDYNYSLIDALIVFYQRERTVSTACQIDPSAPVLWRRRGPPGTITKELKAQLDCAHGHQYTTVSCPYLPQMDLTESENEMSEEQNSLYELIDC